MIKIKKHLALLLFIGMDFNMKKNYWFLSVILFLNSCEDNIKNAESSGTKFSVTFHIGENDRVQDIEQTNDRGYIILFNNIVHYPISLIYSFFSILLFFSRSSSLITLLEQILLYKIFF